MTTNNDTSLRVLHELLRTARDAEQGYLVAADLMPEPELVQLFADKAVQRAKFAGELKARIRSLRGDPDRDAATAGGEGHRIWMEFKARIDATETHAILAEVERGEDIAVMVYRDALAERELDKQTREIIQRQYEFVQAAHDRVRQLRDRPIYAHR